MLTHKGTYSYEEILPWAEEIREELFRQTGGKAVELCGSLRRRCPEIGDIDIITTAPLSQVYSILQAFAAKPTDKSRAHVPGVFAKGKPLPFFPLTRIRGADIRWDVIMGEVQINFYRAEPAYWGAAQLYFTGSKEFNIVMRARAKGEGYKLNDKGLWLNQERIAGRTEEQIFEALGLPYEEPLYRSLGRVKGRIVNFQRLREEKEGRENV